MKSFRCRWVLILALVAPLSMSLPAFSQSYADAGELELVIDISDGNVYIDGNGATNIAGFEFKSPQSQIQDGNYVATGEFMVTMLAPATCSEFDLMGGSDLDGLYPVGTIWGGGMNWTFSYNHAGETVPPQSQDDVTYIPEPATMSLVGLGACMVLFRRRRKRR